MSETATSDRGVVLAPHRAAAEAGRMALAEGGTAHEAVVAMAAATAVACPHRAALGSDAAWLIREPSGKVFALDACGRAGAGAHRRAYERAGFDAIPATGPWAALAAPAAVEGWRVALEMAAAAGGRLPLDLLLGEAARLAREGVPVSDDLALAPVSPDLAAAPGFARGFLDGDGERLKPGAPLIQPRLADTLDHLSRAGLADVYDGDVGRELAADLERMGAPLTREDLRARRATVSAPAVQPMGPDRALGFAFAPGRRLRTALALLDRAPPRSDGDAGFVQAVLAAAARSRALAEDGPLSPQRFDEEAGLLDLRRAAALGDEAPGGEVVLAAVDSSGRLALCAMGLFGLFGSGCVSKATGVLLHNRGAAFALDPASPDALAPYARTPRPPAPLLIETAGRCLGLASADGLASAQVALRAWRFGRSAHAALTAPRACVSGGALRLEPGFDGEDADRLDRLGYRVEPRDALDGPAAGLVILSASGRAEAAADPRVGAVALGR
ncbi:gamma-glutamyltranspeptidase [Methylopila jiangsuensis]|uniref:Gamma-glutamyltranspeptidase n=1 Tax=Methylopila jiangsuensis TaxID=586230 RepID=A0A9W6JIF1_9HYPH|nr:gamma-glutamyltransferase [Methylopila jiangsuensis]MDR6284788.1 gamma-glutamyltranspeptidase/glutathione hydrolase [Methylopila jiangsuensis]GLK77822.1 gamma-glutamyltranspeptidase [Methylopila jiangsuensis]